MFVFDFLFLLETGIKCPVCSKFVLPDDIECHLVMCLTKPRLSYNGNFLLPPHFGIASCDFNSQQHQNSMIIYLFDISIFAEDVLTDAKGECVICLEDLNAGDVIARLPCLCIYHKGWVFDTSFIFTRNYVVNF